MTSTNWAQPALSTTNFSTPQSTTGTRRKYETHITYNTHVLYEGTVTQNTNPVSTNMATPAVNTTNWS